MAPRFFQGNSIFGLVEASPAQSFREVVDACRICPQLRISHADFQALSQKERDAKKQVPFFTAACFSESPCKRVYGKATHCNLIFLDIDPEKEHTGGKWIETGNCPAAPFVSDPETLFTALAGFNFAAHVTASSTPEKPRMRVIVEADKIPLAHYARAVMVIGSLLGLPAITSESKVAVQPMFLPVMFAGSTEEDHPLIAFSLEGRAFTVSDIGEGVFPELSESSNTTKPGDYGADALDFLRAQVPEITLATAREALMSIDADCSRAEWISLAAALKHQFSPHSNAEALDLFVEWSEGGKKFGGEDECRKIWNSYRPTPIGRLPVTIRSLLRQAVASGWDDKKIKETCFRALVRWFEEGATSEIEIMEKGVQKILGMPLISAVQEDVLIHQLCSNAKKRFLYTVTTSSVRRDIARIKAEMKAQEKPLEKMREPLWAKGVCYVSAPQDFFRHRTGERYKAEAFNSIYGRWLLPTEDALKSAGIPVTPATLSRPIVAPKDYGLNHLKIPTVYDYAYDPSKPTDMFFVERGRKFVNTYSPTHPELDEAGADEAGAVFMGHLRNLIAEPEYARTLVDYMAYMVQCPGQKIRWAVLLQGVDGAGKTYVAEAMKAVLGAEHVEMINGTSIKSGYNEWAFGHQLVVLEEVRVTGTNRHEIMNALKPLITNDDISINQKFRDTRQVPNITNYIIFSNHHDALALTPGDRRYFVVKSALQHRSQVLALGENYFPPLYALLRDRAGALRAWLDKWDISEDFHADGHAPRTKYVQELINDTAGDLPSAIRRVLLEGDYPLVQFDVVSAQTLKIVLDLEESGLRASPQYIAQVLREEGFRQIGRHTLGTERHYLWARCQIDEATALARAADRHKTGKKNLCMDLIYS